MQLAVSFMLNIIGITKTGTTQSRRIMPTDMVGSHYDDLFHLLHLIVNIRRELKNCCMSRPLTHALCPQIINPRLSLVDPCPPPRKSTLHSSNRLALTAKWLRRLQKCGRHLKTRATRYMRCTPAQTARRSKATRHASFAQRARLASAGKKSLGQARTAPSCILCAAGATRSTWSTPL
jgi:hypothetical protein